MTTTSFTIQPQGPFSLRESALFGFGQRMRPAGVGGRTPEWDGVLRLAFCADGPPSAPYGTQVGVELRQDGDGLDVSGVVHAVVHGDDVDLPNVQAQVARMLSLDHDARDYLAVGDRDPVIAQVQAAAPGLRPPLFHSPYEAAFWSVLSARRPGWQADRLRAQLSRAHGRAFALAGAEVPALPTPGQVLELGAFPGIEARRWQRLRDVARFAAAGGLEAAVLRAMDPDDAMRHVQQLDGIGPFYAALIVIRATGVTDVLPVNEPRALDIASRLYGLAVPPTPAQFALLAEPWRPWRTWCTVLLRAAASRVLAAAA